LAHFHWQAHWPAVARLVLFWARSLLLSLQAMTVDAVMEREPDQFLQHSGRES
jgi:hypothetical protein